MGVLRSAGFVFAAGCALALAVPASAQWSAKQRTDFVNDCLGACRQNPRVPEAQRPQCDDYCLCIVTEGQKLFNEAQFEQINKDFIAKKQTPEIKQFTDLTPACNRKAFSR
ncbi:MAG: hypothetical protein K2P86_13145 [Xanthobacteraceae bacterium]|nr:hypothetical protein [Xanthobacteraceae bacterium]